MFLIKKAFLNTFLIKIIFIIGIAWTHLSISAVLAKITTISRLLCIGVLMVLLLHSSNTFRQISEINSIYVHYKSGARNPYKINSTVRPGELSICFPLRRIEMPFDRNF